MNKPSVLSTLLLFYLRITNYRKRLTFSWWTKPSNAESPPQEMFTEFTIERKKTLGTGTWSIQPKNIGSKKYIFYLHGGAYSKSFLNSHWNFLAKLIRKTNYTVIAPDYPLSNSSTAKEAFEVLLLIYKDLVDQVGANNIHMMGDSAGGGMALAFSQLLVQEKLDQPVQLILLSPWLDITLSNPQIDDFEARDVILNRAVLQKLGTLYCGNLEPTNFLVSPIYGKITRVSPITLFVGSEEILLPDCKKLKVKAESEPVIFNYREYKGMIHHWMFLPLPDATKALDMIVNQLLLEPSQMDDPIHSDNKFWI